MGTFTATWFALTCASDEKEKITQGGIDMHESVLQDGYSRKRTFSSFRRQV
jgi:hypothetical protein